MYTSTLESNLMPCVEQKHRNGCVFQQDNASIHTAEVSKSYFKEQNINDMELSEKDSDLNPVENVWGVLARAVHTCLRQYSTVDQLKESTLKECSKLDRTYLYSLIKGMQGRWLDVVERIGGKTEHQKPFLATCGEITLIASICIAPSLVSFFVMF